jgi:lipopolysaccharide export system protein LptC
VKRLLLLSCLLACGRPAGATGPTALAPALNWNMTMFTRENFHSMTLRGSRATFPSSHQVNVVDLNLTVFSGDAANRVETIILSTAATFLPQENLAHGDQGVRLIRDDLEATGRQWTYDHAQKKVSLQGRVRVVFNAELKNLLK